MSLNEDLGWFFGYVGLLFVFVIMHEFGHALTARRFGVTTRDVIISPIGGVARLENLPSKPQQELLIAIAGPMVNVVLVIFFIIVQLLNKHHILPQGERINLIASPADFIGYLLVMNGILVVFNMIPAFPMDGGRVLRATLTIILKDKLKATKIASVVGQLFSFLFIGVGIYWDHYMLIFIGLFVLLTARAEYRRMKLESKMSQTKVKDIMLKNYTLLNATDPMETAFKYKHELNFLVQNEDSEIIGSLPHLFIKDAIKNDGGNIFIHQKMSSSFGFLSEGMSIQSAFSALNEYGWAIAAIVAPDQEITGVLDRQIIKNFIAQK